MSMWRRTRRTPTRGERGARHAEAADPPRRRADQGRGHGTRATDRPPVVGVAGRSSRRPGRGLLRRMWGACPVGFVAARTTPGARVRTDEGTGYRGRAAAGRRHATVHPGGARRGDRREWARDDDGDGLREAHGHTREGIRAGLRLFLGPSRGVSKTYPAGDPAAFAWGYDL